MSLRASAIKGVFWSSVETWMGKVVNFAVFLILARLLDPEAFGLVALAGVIIAFLRVFVDQGFTTALIQREELDPEHLDTAFWANMLLAGMAWGICFLAAAPVATFLGDEELVPLIRWLALNFWVTALCGVQNALFARGLEFKLLSARTLVGNVAGGMMGVGMALSGFGVWSLVGQFLTQGAVTSIVLWWASDWRPGFKVSWKHLKDLFSFGINILGSHLLNFFHRRSDNLLIGAFIGATALGYYTIAYNLVRALVSMLTTVTSRVAFPVFSKMQHEPKRLQRAFYTAIRYTTVLAFPIFTGLIVLAPEIVVTVFGAKWAPSVPVMRILGFIGFLHTTTYFNNNVMLAMNRPSWSLGVKAADVIASVAGFALVVQWGIAAVAASFTVVGYALFPLSFWLTSKLVGIGWLAYARQYTTAVLASAGMALLVMGTEYLLPGESMMLLAGRVLLGAAAYVLLVCVLDRGLLREAKQMLRITSSEVAWTKKSG